MDSSLDAPVGEASIFDTSTLPRTCNEKGLGPAWSLVSSPTSGTESRGGDPCRLGYLRPRVLRKTRLRASPDQGTHRERTLLDAENLRRRAVAGTELPFRGAVRRVRA